MFLSNMLGITLLSILITPFALANPDLFVLSELEGPLDDTSSLVTFNHALLRRQTSSNSHPDYTCGPDRPCQNKACCGKSNVCGFGELYCGDGCQSHCDAKAECGRDATTPGTECPLNVCCRCIGCVVNQRYSQFGFCGTTSEFCDTGCQSNCGQPNKPGSGTDARNKIIGYWESWRADGVPCGAMSPESIPVEALDQLNLAFIYIDPETYKLMPMDGGTITKLYERVANTKLRNPNLKVWISVGGWSFNDPGAYRSIFGAIAGDERLSAEFAQNCLDFMNEYGFDGVDIDWEYPGAEDRGGTLSDITNFPRMLGILQKRFKVGDVSGKRFGLSITVPTSYWYLRWFDLPKIAEQIDEFNLMTYDLHGIWDRTDPIGPYVWAHTNLTEIDLALDLFWRNDISSRGINLGLGFYGRTFKLKDSLCSEPGCEFSGPGDEGSCTKSAGILSYREIRALLEENTLYDSAKYDEEAGVYYVTYGEGGQSWVSFDDSVSFQAKVDLANSRGIGGLFIWALDQDNDNLDALRAVSGRDVVVPPHGSGTFGAFDIDKCYITDCNANCQSGDTLMTRLNQDESGRGCDGKEHNQRSFCCPPTTSPDPKTCRWTGGPVNCHGQCSSGEVSMVFDDWGDSKKRCTNGGKKVWCCPATNGQSLIEKCGLVKGKKCPSDRPQDLTYIYDKIYNLFDAIEVDETFCCPSEPKFNNCNWFGDNYYCNDNACPAGQVELFRHHGYHGLPGKTEQMCNKGRQQAFCCDPPFTGGSPFLPVPLENLFPDAAEFPIDYDPVFAEAFDLNKDLTPEVEYSQDPDTQSFAWVIMVGPTADVQSFEKRDGSHLELFDCPDTHPDDFSVQQAKAICLTDSPDNDCEDIMEGGVEGTVVKLPKHCGPDQWVRALRYEESTDRNLPPHLVKRAKPHHKIYDFHYDYDFRNLRRDGGEVHVRIDASNHPGYWNEVVARPAGSPIKRDASSWRDLDRRSFSEDDPSDWKKRFDNLLKDGNVGLKKHYEFDQCLFSVEATCSAGSAYAEAFATGEFNTTMDFGVSLIGTLRTFTFTEAFSYFRQEAFEARVQAALAAKAKLRFDSGFHPVGSFDAFGSNYNIKGILSINPYFSVAARVQAEATVSLQATVELTLKHDRFQYYLPTNLGSLPTEPGGNFQVTSRNGPISTLGDVSASVGGDVIVSIVPTIGFDIQLAFGGKQLVDTSVKLTSQADVDFDIAATAGTSCTGLQLDVKGQFQAQLILENALPGWISGTYEIEQPIPKSIYSDCIAWVPTKRAITHDDGTESLSSNNRLVARQTLGESLSGNSVPRSGTCAFSVKGVYCAEDKRDDADLNCDVYDLEDPDGDSIPDDNDSTLAEREIDDDSVVVSTLLDGFITHLPHSHHVHRHVHKVRENIAHLFEKRGGAKKRTFCDPKDPKSGPYAVKGYAGVSSDSRTFIQYKGFPDSSDIKTDHPNADAFTFEDPTDCNNYNMRKFKASAVTDTKSYGAEHVLENQMFPNFMNRLAQGYSNLANIDRNDVSKANPGARYYTEPKSDAGDEEISWCQYMERWWNNARAPDGRAGDRVVIAYPANKVHEDEMFLLDEKMNSRIKQNWFSGLNLSYDSKAKLQKYIAEEKWAEALKALKFHVVTWKYFLDDDVKRVLVDQVDRVATNLEEVETDYMEDVGNLEDAEGDLIYRDPYEYQGLAASWRTYAEEQHILVQSRVKAMLKKYSDQLYALNRPNMQSNADIVEYMETLADEVKDLQAWNIQWKKP
ncbi:glycoside hydrolase [Aureobasidium subglaciale]|nr:glycoside hydrolase [Aureobasidium subglaciale]KAI5217660.1 glycoside hydrolase [Aureobasidium subglaciale]KAI5221245.1 glycoside hydrolase [Aureobasidium subglaciale]KAI5258951.1 glycoside hydrolase [Aureobasidium subglaciale]